MEGLTTYGKIAIICGILGIIPGVFFGFLGLIFPIFSIGFGAAAKQQGDKYGKYGIILGILAIVLIIVISVLYYVYVSNMLSGV
jgi:hypothetical protein